MVSLLALGVVRVSSKVQAEDDRYSLPNQREQIERYCETRGWQLARTLEYVLSGGSNQRELRQVLEIAKREGTGVVVVYELDRLSRNMISTLMFIDELRQAGIRFAATANEIDLTTPEGELQLHLLSAFAHYFRQQLARKVRGGQRMRAREGKVFGRTKFGYRIGPEGRLEIEEDEARIVRMVYGWYVSEDVGLREIAKRLNGLGVRTKTGKAWGVSSVNLLFRDTETYLGEITYGKWRKDRSDGRLRIVRSEEDYLTVAGAHEPLLDLETIAAAQTKRRIRAEMGGRAAGSPHLMSGLIYCGHCGGKMQASRAGRWSYYVCGNYVRRGQCQRNAVREEEADQAVLDDIQALVEGADTSNLRRAALLRSDHVRSLEHEEATLRRHLGELPEMRRRAEDALLQGVFTVPQYRDAEARLQEDEARTEGRIAEIRDALTQEPDMQVVLDSLKLALRSQTALDRKDPAARSLVQRYLARVVFSEAAAEEASGTLEIWYAAES